MCIPRSMPFILVVGLVLPVQLAAGGQRLSEGDRIRLRAATEVTELGTVARPPDDWLVGRLLAADADYLLLNVESERRTARVQRMAVDRLEVSRGRSRGKPALIGAGIGAAVGLVWGAIEASRCESGFAPSLCGLAVVAVPIVTVPAGALVGFAIGRERWDEVAPLSARHDGSSERRGVQIAVVMKF